jgi:WD40 repeat protein
MQDIADPENLDGPVTNIQFSPDGSLLAASDGNIRIWEAASGKRRCAISARNMADPTQLPSHPYFGSMQFSADGNRLIASAAGRNNRAICSTWKIPEGVRVASKFVDGMRYCGQISVNGQMLSTSDLNQNYFVRCLADGSVLRAFKLPWNGATASDPRLQYVAVTRGGREYRKVPRKEYITEVFSPELQIVEQSTGEVKHILETKLEKEREDLIRVMQFSPKGDTLATGCLSGLLSLWNVRYGGHLRNLGQQLQDPVSDVAFTPDGKVIASASDKNGNISLWNADNGILLTVLQSDSKGIQALGFSPDGKRLASGGIDGAVRIWSDSCDRTVIPTAAIREVKADGRSLLLQLSAVTPTNVKLSYQYRTNSITDWQTTPDGKVELPYKLGTSLWIEARSVAPNGNLSPVVRSVRSFRPDRDEIILKERWDRTPGHIHSIDFGPDGRSLAAGDWQGNVYVWNLAEKDSAYLLEQRKSSICGVAFRDHGKSLVALDASGNICQWNAANWTPQPSHKSPHKPEDSVLSPDGRYVADLRKSDDSAKISIRQTTDGGIVATLDEIVGFSFKMAFSYDGKILAVSMNTPEPQAPTTSAKWKKAPLPSGKWEVISFGVPDGKKRGVITTDDRLSNGVAFEWNAKAIVVGRRLLEYPGGKTICHIGSIGNCPASVCPGAEMVAGTESDYITQAALLKIYRTADRQTVFATRLEKMPTTTVFSPDGNMLAVGMQDGVIRVLRLRCQWESKSSVR